MCSHCDCKYVICFCVFSCCSSFVTHAQVCSPARQRPHGDSEALLWIVCQFLMSALENLGKLVLQQQ